MKPDREALLQRRRELQQRILRESQRQSVAGLVAELESAGVEHELIWPDEAGELGWGWIARRFPIGFARVEWRDVPGSACRRYGSDQERDRLFRALLGEYAPRDGDPVVIVWGNAAKPSIRIGAAAALAHCSSLLDSDFDLWVYSPGGDWLIECYHESEHCAGRAPAG
jgi:hypothetical protein